MFLTFFLAISFLFENSGFYGMPSSATALSCGGAGTALCEDPVYYNPAMLVFSNKSALLVSFYQKNDKPWKGFGEFSTPEGTYINSILAYTPQNAYFWRILEARVMDTIADGRRIDAHFRADEAGMSFAMRDSDIYCFSIGGTIKYSHFSYREVSYPDSGQFFSDSLIIKSFPAHGVYADAGMALCIPGIALGVSAKNLFGKVFKDEIDLPAQYRAGVSFFSKHFSTAYDIVYWEIDEDISHHFCLKAGYGPIISYSGYACREDEKIASFGLSLNYQKYFLSSALWGPADNFQSDSLDFYFSAGVLF
ncbi:hypothetical protein JXA84_08595 [candidate division WOR-3 bacterium]|nr:hypothetical protein [candidate division WOR-3 bacterium]